jgi:hypothetical protein
MANRDALCVNQSNTNTISLRAPSEHGGSLSQINGKVALKHNLRPPSVSGRLPYAKMLAQVAHPDLGS